MSNPKPPRYLRLIARLIEGTSGKHHTIHDLRELASVLRLSGVFGLTIIIPVLLLSYLAINSINDLELSIDVDLSRRQATGASRIDRFLFEQFSNFEAELSSRIAEERSATSRLSELSSYALAAFEIRDGSVQGPFAPPDPPESAPPSPAFTEAIRDGKRAEREERFDDATQLYRRAIEATESLRYAGEAQLAVARVLERASGVDAAEQAYADTIADYGGARDRFGLRIGDLARFHQARLGLQARDAEAGIVSLRELIEDLLDDRWTIGRPGEAILAGEALSVISDRAPPDWVSRVRSQLDEQKRQLFWSEYLYGEVTFFLDGSSELPEDFRYITSPEAPILWASLRSDTTTYLVAFDRTVLLNEVISRATSVAESDSLIHAEIAPTDTRATNSTYSKNLGPWLPFHEVRISPSDPVELQWQKRSQTTTRIIVILIAVFSAVFGVVMAARMVGREVENAKMKTDFAANVSHELRSPITQIRLKAEALQLDLIFGDDDRRAHYDAIVRESERLGRLVDNVLDFAAIERGAKRYTFRPEDLTDLLYRTLDSYRGAVSKAGMELVVAIPDDLPVVWVDREAISQVLVNLISNGIKYGTDGKWLEIAAIRSEDAIELTVSDRGMGIPEDEIPRIFENFYRSGDTRVRRRKGTGIGLAIVRYIVEAHGGTIEVQSQVDHGTRFSIRLPLEPPTDAGS